MFSPLTCKFQLKVNVTSDQSLLAGMLPACLLFTLTFTMSSLKASDSKSLYTYTSFTRARLLGLARISSDRFEKVPSSHELQKHDLAWKIKAPNIKYLL